PVVNVNVASRPLHRAFPGGIAGNSPGPPPPARLAWSARWRYSWAAVRERAAGVRAQRGRRPYMRRLDGKVGGVTGASRGIGAEIARLFAAEGGRVLCAARTLREGDHQLAGSLETTVAAIREAGGEARAITVNIADPAECEKLVRAAEESYGPVDV